MKRTIITLAIIYSILTIVLYSCTKPNALALKRYEVKEGGMLYIIYRDASGGVFIINPTKDSLNNEYLRKCLSEK